MTKIIDSFFYNVISACEIIQTKIYGLGTYSWGFSVLRAIMAIFTFGLFILLMKLFSNVWISSILAAIPIGYFFYFSVRDTESQYQDELVKFKSLPKVVKRIYYAAVIIFFIILPLTVFTLAIVT